MTLPDTNPSSWRDVYALVRDSRADVLDAVGEVNDRVDILTIKFADHQVTHATDAALVAGRVHGRDDVFGVARATIAIFFSFVSAAVAVAAVVLK